MNTDLRLATPATQKPNFFRLRLNFDVLFPTQRHEAVKQCLNLSSEVKAQTLSLDLLEDQVNDIVSVKSVHTGTDVSNVSTEVVYALNCLCMLV